METKYSTKKDNPIQKLLETINPITTKHTNIWLFQEFGLALTIEPPIAIHIVLGFISIHIFKD